MQTTTTEFSGRRGDAPPVLRRRRLPPRRGGRGALPARARGVWQRGGGGGEVRRLGRGGGGVGGHLQGEEVEARLRGQRHRRQGALEEGAGGQDDAEAGGGSQVGGFCRKQ